MNIFNTVDSKVASRGQAFTLGQSYGGGYVFFIDATRKHGLILSVDNVSGGPYTYGNSNSTAVIGAFSSDGQNNTTKIIKFYGGVPKNATPYAALAAKNYKGGGYNDWYLPSAEEFGKIFAVGNYQSLYNIGADVYYLTSSEDHINYVGIQVLLFGSALNNGLGGIIGTIKNYPYAIRAVRKF
jgi:hypothetical protein